MSVNRSAELENARDGISHQVVGSCRRTLPAIGYSMSEAPITSFSKHARDRSPDPPPFCNSFWGPNDAGVDILFARMRGAAGTMEELRDFWKERYLFLAFSVTALFISFPKGCD